MNVPVDTKEDEDNLDAVYMMLDPDGSADHSFSEFVSILVVAKVSKAKLLTSKDVVVPPSEPYMGEVDEQQGYSGRGGDTIDGYIPDSPAARVKELKKLQFQNRRLKEQLRLKDIQLAKLKTDVDSTDSKTKVKNMNRKNSPIIRRKNRDVNRQLNTGGQSADDLTRPSAAKRASETGGTLSVDSVAVAPKSPGSPIAKVKGSAVVAGRMRAAGARDYSGDGGGGAGKRVGKGTASRSSFASGSLGTQL